ncbi:MAG: prepilin peptidase [Eubacteriales bacterium]|nr:prepilin peptidase [Eubacteriales bacterium]
MLRTISPGWAAYLLALTGLLGACLGSFFNCAAWRHVRGESALRGRSRCPACGHVLTPLELIPLVSYFLQRGHCRACGAPLSRRYPATEGLLALVFISLLARFGPTAACLQWMGLACALFYLSLVDMETMELPDGPMIAAAVWFLALSPLFPDPWGRLRAGAVGAVAIGGGVLLVALVMDKVLGRDSLGGGDIKLLALTGLYLGWVGNLLLLIVACLVGLPLALRKGRGVAFPFGPAIALAAWPVALCGQPVIEWYLGLL